MLRTVGEVQEVVLVVEVVLVGEMDEVADYEMDQEVEQPPFTLNSCSGLWVMRSKWA